MIIYIYAVVNKVTAVQRTKPSSDDDSRVRHSFSVNISLTLTQSVPTPVDWGCRIHRLHFY